MLNRSILPDNSKTLPDNCKFLPDNCNILPDNCNILPDNCKNLPDISFVKFCLTIKKVTVLSKLRSSDFLSATGKHGG